MLVEKIYCSLQQQKRKLDELQHYRRVWSVCCNRYTLVNEVIVIIWGCGRIPSAMRYISCSELEEVGNFKIIDTSKIEEANVLHYDSFIGHSRYIGAPSRTHTSYHGDLSVGKRH